MKNNIYILFFILFYSVVSDAQTIVLNMSKNPPPAALDWLKNPQPIRIIVTSPTNLGQAKVRAVVTKGGKTVITSKLEQTLPISLNAGTKLYYGTDFWNQNSFNISTADVNFSSGKLKPGDYQICVTLVTPTGAPIGNARTCANFQITEFQEPTLFLPDNNTVIQEERATGMAFRWAAVTPHYIGIVKYRFQIFEILNGMTAFQAVNFSPIEEGEVTNLTQYLWTNAAFKIRQAKLGNNRQLRYVWRVQALDAMNNQPIGRNPGANLGFSEIRTFTINPTATTSAPNSFVRFREPTLFFPNDRASVTAAESRNGFTFKWNPVTPQYRTPVKYRFQLFEANNNTTPIVQEEIANATEYTWKKEKASGTSALTYYRWRVQAIDARTNKPIGMNSGANLGFSDTRLFNLGPTEFEEPKLSSPANNTMIASNRIKDGINFQWSSITPQYDGVVTYRLQVYKVTEGRPTASALTSRPVFVQDIANNTQSFWRLSSNALRGKYAWRVQALGVDPTTQASIPLGSKSGSSKGFSEIGEFTLEAEQLKFQEPTLAAPTNKNIVNATEALNGVKFKWNEVQPKYATPIDYSLHIYALANNQTIEDALKMPPIEIKTFRDGSEYTWVKSTTANESKFVWRVQAIDAAGNRIGQKNGLEKGFSDAREFSIVKTTSNQQPTAAAAGNAEPTLASPVDKNSFNKSDVFGKGIILKWNPVTPQYRGSIEYSITILPKTSTNKKEDYYNAPQFKVNSNGGGTVTDKTEYTWKVPDLKSSADYVWFVQAKDAKTKKSIGQKKEFQGFSDTREFTVSVAQPAPPKYAGPALVFPDSGKQFSKSEISKGIELRWKLPPRFSNQVEVQVFEVTNGNTVVEALKNRPVQSFTPAFLINSSTFTSGVAGKTYAWRLSTGGANSPARTFSIKEIAYTEPKLIEPNTNIQIITANTARKGLTFLWEVVTPLYSGIDNYLLKVYEIQDGKTVADALKTTPVLDKTIKKAEIVTSRSYGNRRTASYTWKMDGIRTETKKYVWQVQAVDEKGGIGIGSKAGKDKGFSETREFTIAADEITEPELAFPADKGKINPKELKDGLTLKWSGVSPRPIGDIKYRVKIFEIPKDKKAADALKTTPSVNEVVTNKMEFTWKKKYETEAQFVWNVQALDANDKPIGKKADALKGFSANFEFQYDTKLKDDSLSITDCDGKKKIISNKGLDKSSASGDFKNKFVKINEFSMLIKEATGSSTALSGKGSIVVSWLKTPIAVEFSNISVDGTMKVTKGDVFAIQDADASDLPKFLKATNTAAVTKTQVKSLNTKLKANKAKLVKDQNLDDRVKEMATDKTPTLPLGINDVLGYTIAISEMKFSPDKNTLVGIGIIPYNKVVGGEDVIAFAAADIVFDASSPSKSGGKMVLLEDFNIEDPSESSYGVTFKAKKNNQPATFIQWGCKGFEKLSVSVDVDLPKSWVTPADEKATGNVIANGTAEITNLNDWLVSLSIQPCKIEGLEDVEMAVKELVFDNSDKQNAKGIKFPQGYVGTQKEDFRGVFIKSASLTLPKFYNKGSDTGIEVAVENFIINKQGITGTATVGSKENPIVSLKDGTVGDFQASIETFELEIVSKSIKKAAVNGKMVLPISKSTGDKPNTLAYEAKWEAATTTAKTAKTAATTTPARVQLTIKPDGKLNAEFLGGSELTLNNTSSVAMTYTKGKTKTEKGKITAEVKLNGSVEIEKKLMDKIPVNFAMKFQNIGFDYDNSKTTKACSFKKPTFAFASPQKKVAGFPVTISSADLVDDATVATGYWASAKLEVEVKLNLDEKISGSTKLFIQGGIKKEGTKYTPSVIGATISDIELAAKVSAVDMSGKIAFYNNDPTYGDGFKGEVKANFTKVGELTAAVQFGSVKPANATESFRYWYAEGKLILQKGIPIIGPLGLKGAGVGAWYHMTASNMPNLDANAVADASDKKETKSGATFTPDAKTLLGFKFTGIVANTSSDKTFNGDMTLSAEFNTSGGINFLQLDGAGFIGSGLKERSKAPIQGKLVAKYDFVQEVFDLNVAVKIKYPTVGIAMFETIQDATLSLNVDSKNKIGNEPKWSLTVGTPASPNKLYYYSVPTWAYFRAGNNLTVNSGFQPATLAGLRSVDPAFNPVMEPLDENAKGGKGFDFGIGFNKSGNTSVGPFSGGYSVGAELNLSMAQYDASNGCVTDKFNYWYARGGVAAWANANISFKGLVSASLGAAGMMQAGAPEPLWIKGRVAGKIGLKVLFVRININASVPFSYGTPCKPKKAAAAETESFTSTDEIGVNDLVEFGDMYMHSSGATDRISPVTLISTFDLSYRDTENTFELESMENGNKIKKTYKVDLDWYVTGTLITNPGAGVHYPGSPKYSGWQEHNMKDQYSTIGKEGDGYSLGTWWYGSVPRNRIFAYGRKHLTRVVATMKVKNARGQWEVVKNKDGKELIQNTRNMEFTTHN